MGLETATYISQLVDTNPTTADGIAQGDDHLRMLKTVLQTQFPNLGAVAVVPTAAELNYVDGVTSAIQTQLNDKLATASALGRWVRLGTANAASAVSIDFINGVGGIVFNSTYDVYWIEIVSLVGGSGQLWMRTTTDAANFDVTAGNYKYTTTLVGSSSATDGGTATAMQVAQHTLGSTPTVGDIIIVSPSTAAPARIRFSIAGGDGTQPLMTIGSGYRVAAADIDGFRLLNSNGAAFTSGTVNLYGRVKA